MFVCLCNAIRDRDIRDLAPRCRGDAAAAYAMLGKAPQCGSCLDDADAILEEERALGCATAELVAG